MGNWTVGVTPRTVAGKAEKRKLDWTKLEEHLREIGTLHTSIYRLARDLSPAIVLGCYWFFTHPGIMFQGYAWWSVPRISVMEIGMLGAVTFVSRAITSGHRGSNEELLHKETSASFLAALLCALVIYPALFSKFDWEQALQVDVEFFLATSLLNLIFLASACFVG